MLGVAVITGYALAHIKDSTKTKNTDLCDLPIGGVENVVGEVISIRQGSLGRASLLIGNPSSQCTVAINATWDKVKVEVGDIILVKGMNSSFGVNAESILRNPNLAYDLTGSLNADVVVGHYSYHDAYRASTQNTSEYLYKIPTLKGDLVVPDALLSTLNQYGTPTKLRLSFDRNLVVTSITKVE